MHVTSPGCFQRVLTRSAAHLRRMSPIFAGVVRTTPGLFTPKLCPGLGAGMGPAGRQNARKSIFSVGSSPSESAAAGYGGRNGSLTVCRCPLTTQKCGKAREELQAASKRPKKQGNQVSAAAFAHAPSICAPCRATPTEDFGIPSAALPKDRRRGTVPKG